MLLRTAVRILRDPSSSPCMIACSVVTLAEAGVHQRIPVPLGTADAVWNVLRAHADARWASLAAELLGEIAPAEVVAEIFDALRCEEVSVALTEVSLESLAGTATAARVADHDILDVAERVRGYLLYSAARLIQAVGEHRIVPQVVVAQVADGWSHRERIARVAALDLLELMSRDSARKLVGRALEDDHRSVRSAAASKVADVFEVADGLALVKHRITLEKDSAVIADLLRVQAELIA